LKYFSKGTLSTKDSPTFNKKVGANLCPGISDYHRKTPLIQEDASGGEEDYNNLVIGLEDSRGCENNKNRRVWGSMIAAGDKKSKPPRKKGAAIFRARETDFGGGISGTVECYQACYHNRNLKGGASFCPRERAPKMGK